VADSNRWGAAGSVAALAGAFSGAAVSGQVFQNPATRLQEVFARAPAPQQVRSQIAELDTARQQELLRINQEIGQAGQRLQGLNQEIHQQQLGKLEARIKELETERETLKRQDRPAQTQTRVPSDQARDNYRVSAAFVGANPPQPSQVFAGPRSGMDSAGQAGRTVAHRGEVGDTNSAGARGARAVVSTTSRDDNAGRTPASTTGPSANRSQLVIASTEARPRVDVQPQELSQEVLQYLMATRPDANVLQQIKEEGMVYRYRVSENGAIREREMRVEFERLPPETKRFIELQLAQSSGTRTPALVEEEIQIAQRVHSYASLRLLMEQLPPPPQP
jgi:hypothetical protein